ncbi:hypothetical protein K9692_004667 [Escherichia coli]|jgi:RecJ-like exonuclease|uniref:hypothetical protein n=1 Tax=Buttiauxella gaviniae TaxID=82990 RepID=UPI001DB1EA3B|nr:hypothetical protein [Escherichia coli]
MENKTYYDCSGVQVSLASIVCVNDVLGTAEYNYRVLCNKCNGRGERNHFYKSKCMQCHGTGYSLVSTRTAYTLDKLFHVSPVAARKVRDAQFNARLKARDAEKSSFNSWYENHRELVDAIKGFTRANSFLDSLKSTLDMQRPLSEKQLAVAAKITGIN